MRGRCRPPCRSPSCASGFPPARSSIFSSLDDRARYVGVVDLAEAHAAELDDRLSSLAASDLAKGAMHVAAPDENIRVALSASSPAGPRSWP